jgi:sporulation protein YlmC with PRC-barrel domain
MVDGATDEKHAMLRHQSEIIGYAIHASDGYIGTVSDHLFEDTTWLVRWLVVDTGHWLPGRKLLLPPSALAHINHIGRQFNVGLTRQQVKDCPNVDTDLPVSRQMETSIYGYYGWSPYWGGGSYMGMVDYGGYLGGPLGSVPSAELIEREKEIDAEKRSKSDPTLRSVREVAGYHIHASDGEIGHVEDFLVEDDDWSIRYLVVETKNWWPGATVLISPLSVQTIQWVDQQVNLRVDRQSVKDSSEYDPSATADPINRKSIHKYNSDLRTRINS